MKLAKFDSLVSLSRLRLVQFLMGVLFLYLLFISFEIPLVFKTTSAGFYTDALPRPLFVESEEDFTDKSAPARPTDDPELFRLAGSRTPPRRMWEYKEVSGLLFNESSFDSYDSKDEFSVLHKTARHAFVVGKKLWDDLQSPQNKSDSEPERQNQKQNRTGSCPESISLSGSEFVNRSRVLVIPCGLTLGSHITVIGMPHWAHAEYDPKIAILKEGDESVMVTQFMMELQGLKTVEGEDPPRILHFNPRLKGDWSGKPVIEQNTCYRMQWGTALRCEGWTSRADEETEGRLFVLTLSAGLEGYHVNVDGRHVTSFPYRTGFVLEDATGLSLKGDLDVHSVFAAALPTSHPSFAPQKHLERLSKWKAPPLPEGDVELFIGVLSAGNHFAERMAVRKSWVQHKLIKSSKVVARFFVALNGRKDINVELKKEAEYFGDIVVVPYMDNYDLVVLKTVAICEYGIRTVAAKYIMKCDDDTFVRVDPVIKEAKKLGDRSLYIGNMNYYHKPLRNGKWAVTYEEWPEEEYPPYANGPGYIVSSDIAQFIVDEFENHKLRLFKMEDVSMGMWVEKFNSSKAVEYQHSLKFCQFGCIEDYYTAHYQSPRQMLCMWDKLQKQGKPQCCNMR
ncbi:hypothetical protein GOBAR_AA37865 [Gossypium barbadense]|uniref:Galectin domain-containing protein n=1 Tax=Gossypium barbadense TaxID=3634 RepID=A0A2P5VVK1_GOSBA|nr:hypothetical protein GOBAR_AA37865 [Gossypium barbadense]